MRIHIRESIVAVLALTSACADEPTELVIDDHPIGETVIYRAEPSSLVRYHDIALVTPEETGQGVGVVLDGETTWQELEVENTGDGFVSIRVGEPLPVLASDAVVEAALGQCADGAFLLHHRWGTRFDWWLNTDGIPAGFVAKAEAAIQRAASNIVDSRNSCGLTDQVSAAQSYRGRTTASLGINKEAVCTGRNNRNVVGFRTMKAELANLNAATCWYWGASQLLEEADIAFNLLKPWDTGATVSAGCTNLAHLEGIGTHELGHAFGLLHPPGEHPSLTMYPSTPACDASDATLGRGDVLGLRSLY